MPQSNKVGPLISSDVKLSSCALAAGGRLSRIEEVEGRLTFHIDGVGADFALRVANGEVVLPARDFLSAMEQILRLVSEAKRGRGRR